jgi:hypothetical protein
MLLERRRISKERSEPSDRVARCRIGRWPLDGSVSPRLPAFPLHPVLAKARDVHCHPGWEGTRCSRTSRGRLTPVTHIGSGFTRLGFCVDDFCALHRSIITHRSAAVSNRYADQVSTTWTRRCSKNFSITESLRFLFRAEAFNTPNTPPFAQPTQLNFTTLTDFSAITSTRNSNQNFGARTLQPALKMFY